LRLIGRKSKKSGGPSRDTWKRFKGGGKPRKSSAGLLRAKGSNQFSGDFARAGQIIRFEGYGGDAGMAATAKFLSE
jgi:hypothetical protein